MADYVVTGRIFDGPQAYQYPWNIVDGYPIGGTITIELAPDDEQLLIANRLISPVPAGSTLTLTLGGVVIN